MKKKEITTQTPQTIKLTDFERAKIEIELQNIMLRKAALLFGMALSVSLIIALYYLGM